MAIRVFTDESLGNEEGGITGTKLLLRRALAGRDKVSRVASPLRMEAPAPFTSSWGEFERVTIIAVILFPVVSSIKGRVDRVAGEGGARGA